MRPPVLDCLRPTIVRVFKLISEDEVVQWVRGDCPVFEDRGVKAGLPSLNDEDATVCALESDFEANECCFLFTCWVILE